MSNRGVYQYCKIQKKVVPKDEVMVEVTKKATSLFSSDEMEPTRHPIDGKYYTSKAKFREVTKAHGYEEVGTAYENGYDPELQYQNERTIKLRTQIRESFLRNLNDRREY